MLFHFISKYYFHATVVKNQMVGQVEQLKYLGCNISHKYHKAVSITETECVYCAVRTESLNVTQFNLGLRDLNDTEHDCRQIRFRHA